MFSRHAINRMKRSKMCLSSSCSEDPRRKRAALETMDTGPGNSSYAWKSGQARVAGFRYDFLQRTRWSWLYVYVDACSRCRVCALTCHLSESSPFSPLSGLQLWIFSTLDYVPAAMSAGRPCSTPTKHQYLDSGRVTLSWHKITSWGQSGRLRWDGFMATTTVVTNNCPLAATQQLRQPWRGRLYI